MLGSVSKGDVHHGYTFYGRLKSLVINSSVRMEDVDGHESLHQRRNRS